MSATLTRRRVPIKILTADDHPLLREALTRLITELGVDAEVLETDSLRGAEELLAVHGDFALVILDVMLPDATGIEAAERVILARPDLPLLVVSAKDDPETARAVLDAGARNFISKRSPTRVLAEAIRLVLVGRTYVPPQALRASAVSERDECSPSADADPPTSAKREAADLAPRQFEALRLLVQAMRAVVLSWRVSPLTFS